jgi:predicted anti-sigma-YlaC factor YlaD
MDCRHFKEIISARMGELFLEHSEKEHLAMCPECSRFFDQLLALENDLRAVPKAEINPAEIRAIERELDKKIDRYQNRALRFYRLSVRYGATVAAVALLLFVSLTGQFGGGNGYKTTSDNQISVSSTTNSSLEETTIFSTGSEYASDTSETADNTIGDQYSETVIRNYVLAYGFNAGEVLLGDSLSAAELEYLKDQIKVGDIL